VKGIALCGRLTALAPTAPSTIAPYRLTGFCKAYLSLLRMPLMALLYRCHLTSSHIPDNANGPSDLLSALLYSHSDHETYSIIK
jgi:hypothetical protein